MSTHLDRALHWYLRVLMGGLLLQGLGSLLFRLAPALPAAAPLLVRGIFGIDFWHAWIHIAWGAVGVAILAMRSSRRTDVALALAFGVFYTALGIAGVTLHHPLGLELGWFENSFHLTAGPLTLVLGGVGWLRQARGESRA
ncbi:MAG: hypothetical protein ACJ8CR_10995 [Roseiflexaceae bacterium]